MVHTKPRWKRLFLAAVFTIGLLFAPLTDSFAKDQSGNQNTLDLDIDRTPINRGDSAPRTSYAPIIQKVAPSIVNVYSKNIVKVDQRRLPFFNHPFFRRFFDREQQQQEPLKRKKRSLGSGVIISSKGYALTNHHVVKQADKIRVAMSQSDQEYPAKLIGSDPKTDLAVLKIKTDKTLPVATLGDSSKVKVGDIAFAIGNPFGVGQTVTKGIVSAKSRGIGLLDYEKFIQTDASINPGNSGGALIDAKGRVIGINTVIMSRSGGSQGVGFSIPINLAQSVARSLVEKGEVSRGFLGVRIQKITPRLKQVFGLNRDHGVLISEAMEGMPAAKAGLKRGDVIVSFNGNPVKDVQDLQFAVAQTNPGKEVTVRVIRKGEEKTFKVTLTERPDQGRLSKGEAKQHLDALKGVSLTPLTQKLRRRLKIPDEVKGLVVTGVKPGSKAAGKLRKGDVIVEVNRQPVRSKQDVRKAIRSGSKDAMLLYVWRDGSGLFIPLER